MSNAPPPIDTSQGHRRRLGRGVAFGSLAALVAGAFAVDAGPFGASASSHREAPIIAGDPRADNTDLYAFVSPDDPTMVTIVSNWIPFEEPNGGPNFYDWADSTNSGSNTTYTIKVDSDGDAKPDLTYSWEFKTVRRDANNQFLYNTGVISSLDDVDLNVYQTYTLKVTDANGSTTTRPPGPPQPAPPRTRTTTSSTPRSSTRTSDERGAGACGRRRRREPRR